MPEISLDLSDAAELAEMLAFLADWLSGSHKQALQDSLTAFAGHTAYNTEALRADLHRFTFLLGASDGEELFGEPTPCFASNFVSHFPAPREAAKPSRNDGRNDTAIPCPVCGTFCRRIGLGGTCAACDEPVAISDLITTCRPGNIANRQNATPQENQ